jgi:hypothetical protein
MLNDRSFSDTLHPAALVVKALARPCQKFLMLDKKAFMETRCKND